ncbi:2-amino-4-hydroxy-6-hydroxymethyldihydropteridine diphosphokinase [Magnetovibrio sp. PR-2]|uniref:2-amino-4-hydroxy-6- hydroxymethyldihydropteridine diphosphokinase n=1 Tax=Magnetovibrio sp. PR-2 TaxID=3120356 RepID=UPI002FCE1336
MILIGLGANLPSDRFGSPVQTLEAALDALSAHAKVRVLRRSRWFESAPVPMSDQPWYVNGVCIVETPLEPAELLAVLHQIETDFGRVRAERNAPRVLDLDLLAFDDLITDETVGFSVPHPRMHERGFVLLPIRDLVPGWTHPVLFKGLEMLIKNLPEDQVTRPKEMLHRDIDDEEEGG